MSSITETIARLAARRGGFDPGAGGIVSNRLTDLENFGSNPGALGARLFAPEGLAAGAALVVALHGCTQTADGYDHGAGWSQLAEEHGFVVLLPEQRRANNANLCFDWFRPEDSRRGAGEALSIAQMVATVLARHPIDPARVFVTGLSAGGAMAAVMLATYPELFAGGAIIAGLPYGTASSVGEALERMAGRNMPGEAALADLVRRASAHDGPWPAISIWHGDADTTVNLANAEALGRQWRAIHGVGPTTAATESGAGYRRRIWRDAAGRDVIEEYIVPGMGHGVPLDASGADGCGASGPYMLDVGVSSTRLIAARWGLLAEPRATGQPRRAARDRAETAPHPALAHPPIGLPASVERTIKDALRKAGLLG